MNQRERVPNRPVPLNPAAGARSGSARPASRRGAVRTISTRIRVLVGAVCIVSGLTGLAAPMMSGEVHADVAGSAVTVHGTGDFANLAVTVGQTKDLVNQRVRLSWTGAPPTKFNNSEFAADFLQFMQCWGDPVTGPDRTQCQYGVLNDNRNPNLTPDTRRLDVQYQPPAGSADPITTPNVPFNGSDGTVATVYNIEPGDTSSTSFTQLFDRQSTNEIAYAQSASDGTGQVDFETETAEEAPHLGCGNAQMVDAQGHAYQCFLVIVPRGETEVDGFPYNSTDPKHRHPEKELVSSPLAAANWANHISVPLTFIPQGDACPGGQKTYPIVGSEQMAEAMRLWTPQACHSTQSSFNLIRLSDDQARGLLASPSDPGMSFVGRAISPDDLQPKGPVVYAPVSLSGLTISYEVDQVSSFSADPSIKVHDGIPLTGMKLTPKLVAKLLTQSYKNGVHLKAPEMQAGGAMANNPVDISDDPEFVALNPQFNGLLYNVWVSQNVLTPATGADAVADLWNWINGDKAARDFLNGKADTNPDGTPGMVVNPNYKSLSLPISSFPKQDPYCDVPNPDAQPPSPPLCAPDLHPWAGSMLIAGRGIARGDSLAKTIWTPANNPPSYVGGAQPTGLHSLMGVIDTATAQRFGLQSALLQNAAGNFVAPDEAGLTASVNSMTTVNGLAFPDPRTKAPNAYPLTHLTYAATVPSGLSKEEGGAYADFLAYAVGSGQVAGAAIGKLAPGYVPLPADLQTKATTAIANIRAQAGNPVTQPPSSSSSSAPSSAPGSGSSGPGQVINIVIPGYSSSPSPTGSHSSGPTSAPTTRAAGYPTGQQQEPPAGGVSTAPQSGPPSSTGAALVTGGVHTPTPKPSSSAAPASLTPAGKLGAIRLTLLILLIAGGALILAGPALRSWAAKLSILGADPTPGNPARRASRMRGKPVP